MKSVKKKKKGVLYWKKELWKIFSIYIRKKYADDNGHVQCVTCRRWGRWQDFHAGHFIPGRNNAILFEEKCVHPQCYSCNVGLKGNWTEYLGFMERTYGKEVIEELIRKKDMVVIRKVPEILEMIELYDGKIKNLQLP